MSDEIRQNTAATTGQTRQALAELNQDWLKLITADRAFAELFNRAWKDFGEVTPEEERLVEMMQVLNLRRLENVFFQYDEGLVAPSALNSYGLAEWTPEYMSNPRFQNWWRTWRNRFHQDFVAYLEGRSAEP